MRKIILLLFIFLVPACASGLNGGWHRDGATNDEFHRDRGQCLSEARAFNRSAEIFDPVIFIGCMQGKGWYWKEKPQ